MVHLYIVACFVAIVMILREIPEETKIKLGGYVAAAISVALVAVLFGGVFYGALAEEDVREVPAVIVSVDGDKVTAVTQEGEAYKYYADLSIRLILWKDEVIDAVLEEEVEAVLVGFDISRGVFILETSEGELEEFFLEEEDYQIGDKYFVYYAEGYAPRCTRREVQK
jgi:hypothetical protein